MSDTIPRLVKMLSHIPAAPAKATAQDLHRKLEREGFEVSGRTVERDLHKLSGFFPLRCDEARPAGWSWALEHTKINLPALSPSAALTMDLVARYLKPILPPSLYEQLEPEFRNARHVLETGEEARIGRWSRHVAVLPSGHQLIAPAVDDDVRDTVYTAVLEGRQLLVNYHSMSTPGPTPRHLHALGLVLRDSTLYLVARPDELDDVRVYALHRMSRPTIAEAAAVAPQDFDFQQYVQKSDLFEMHWGRNIRLVMDVAGWVSRHLSERAMAADQKITPLRARAGDWSHVTATLAGSEQLFWWLRSLGSSVIVRKPASLRKRLAEDAKSSARNYQ